MIVSIYATGNCREEISHLKNYEDLQVMYKEKGIKETAQFLRKFVDYDFFTIKKALIGLFDEDFKPYVSDKIN